MGRSRASSWEPLVLMGVFTISCGSVKLLSISPKFPVFLSRVS